MNTWTSAISLLLLILIAAPLPVAAHITESDGPISILLHVDPNDDPIAGPPTPLHFLIKDSSNTFSVESCNCQILIGNYTDRESLAQNAHVFALTENAREHSGSRVYSIEHTFPKKGIYSIIVQGAPKAGVAFTPFKVQFNLRVGRADTHVDTPLTLYLAYGMMVAGATLLLFVGYLLVRHFRQSKSFIT